MGKLPRNVPIPDDPTNLSKDQVDAMLSVAYRRLFAPGTRVRIHSKSDRLNGLTGTVTTASAETAWVTLDPVDADDLHPEEIRFYAGELEKIGFDHDHFQEAQEFDPDAPEPYAAALDYLTPLRELGYHDHLPAYYWKSFNNPSWRGRVDVQIEPVGTAANITAYYIGQGERIEIMRMAVPAVDVLDRIREIEQMLGTSGITSSSQLVDLFNSKLWPENYRRITDIVYRAFGESVPDEPDDDPQRLFGQIQDHARVINIFREETGLRLRRRPRGDRRYYELMSAMTHTDDDLSYIVSLEPLADGSWSIGAVGTKYFPNEQGDPHSYWEEFEIQQAWEIPAGADDNTIVGIAQQVWHDLQGHRGPDEHTPDVFGESADDINFDAYAKEAAGYNPVQLLTSKEVRAWIREAGYKVNTVYRSKRTTGWNFTATPGSDEVFKAFRDDPDREKYRVHELLRKKLELRFPSYTEFELLKRLYLHVWNWSGATSANPDDPHNYVLYVDIQPEDADNRKNGLLPPPVKESEFDDFDPERYAKTTIDPDQFLEAAGWTRGGVGASGAFKKVIPLPRRYVMGSMVFTKLVIIIHQLLERDRSAHITIRFTDDQEKGLPIGFGWTLIGQKRFDFDKWDDDLRLGNAVKGAWDTSMPLRKFVVGIVPLLSTVKWPDNQHSTLVAASHVDNAVSKFVADLNELSTKPLGPAPQQESLDPDAPEGYVRSLGTLAHVAARFGMRRNIDVGHSEQFVRDVPFHYPMSIHYQGKDYTSQAARVFLYWTSERSPMVRVDVWLVLDGGGVYRLWNNDQRYKSEAAAALHLNEALNYLFQSLDDSVEGHRQDMLRDIIGMGVTPFMRRAADEDEDPD